MPEPSTMEQIKSPEQSEQELLTEREQPPREEFPEAGLRDEAPGQQAPEALELLEEEDSLPPVDASEEAEAPALNEAPSRPKRAMSSAPSRKVPPRLAAHSLRRGGGASGGDAGLFPCRRLQAGARSGL